MLKIIIVTAVMAIAVGILVGLHAAPDAEPSGGQFLTSAMQANTDVPQHESTSPERVTSSEQLDTEIRLLTVLEKGVLERNGEYEDLIAEITRLRAIKSILDGELSKSVFGYPE